MAVNLDPARVRILNYSASAGNVVFLEREKQLSAKFWKEPHS